MAYSSENESSSGGPTNLRRRAVSVSWMPKPSSAYCTLRRMPSPVSKSVPSKSNNIVLIIVTLRRQDEKRIASRGEIVNGRAGCIRCSNHENVRFRHEQRTGNTLLSQRHDRRGLLRAAPAVPSAAGALFLYPQGRAGLRQVHLPAPRRRRGARRRALGRLAALRGRPGLARRRVFPAKTRRLL